MRNKKLTIGHFVAHKPEVRKFQTTELLPLSHHYIGIEVEAEGIPVNIQELQSLFDYWEVIEDASLRNHGVEFVSIPVQGQDILNALDELCLGLQELNIQPIFNYRTSVHIHTDLRSFSFSNLRSLLVLYSVCEPWLFNFVGKARENNAYCKPVNANLLAMQGFKTLLHTKIKSYDHGSLVLNQVIREYFSHYDALSLTAMHEHGTAEFRHLYGTLDKQILVSWIASVLHMIDYAQRHRVKDIVQQVLQRGAFELVQRALPTMPIVNDPLLSEEANNTLLLIAVVTKNLEHVTYTHLKELL